MKKQNTKPTKKIKKRPVGRPSTYKKKYAQMMIDYFSIDPFELDETGKRRGVRFPTLERFAVNIGVFVDTLSDWANAKLRDGITPKHPEFLRALRQCKSLQKDILVANGLDGNYASNFATFVAINFTDMVDKSEIDATSGGERIVAFNYIKPIKPSDDTGKTDNTNN